MEIRRRYPADVKLNIASDMGGAMPVGGVKPTESAIRQQIKRDILADPSKYGYAANQKITANVDVTEEDVAAARERQKQLEQAALFEWVSSMVDVRDPGMLAWLNQLLPEYAEAQMEQMRVNQDLFATAQKIKHFGIQDRDDLFFQYLLDTGSIRDTRAYEQNKYIPGWLVPRGSIGTGGNTRRYHKGRLGYHWGPPDNDPRGEFYARNQAAATGVSEQGWRYATNEYATAPSFAQAFGAGIAPPAPAGGGVI